MRGSSPEMMSDRFTNFLVRFTLFMLGVAACLTIIGIPIGIKIFKDLFRKQIFPPPTDASWDPASESLVASWDDFTMNDSEDS